MIFTHIKFHRVGYPMEYMDANNKLVQHEVTLFDFEADKYQQRPFYVVIDESGKEHHVDGETFREIPIK